MTALAYKLPDAAQVSGLSIDTLKRAIRATDPKAWPPPLRAKKGGHAQNAQIVILHADLMAWLASFPDA